MLNQGSGFSSSNKPSQSQSHQPSKQTAEPWLPSGCLYHLLCRVYCFCWLSTTHLQPSACLLAAKPASSSDQCQMAEPQAAHYPDDSYKRVNQVDSAVRQFKRSYLRATLAIRTSFSGRDAWKLFPHSPKHEAAQCKVRFRNLLPPPTPSYIGHEVLRKLLPFRTNFQVIILGKMGKTVSVGPI